MTEITIQVEDARVRRAFEEAPRKTSIALLRSLTSGTRSAHTLAGRLVAKDMGIKVGDAKESVRVNLPTGARLEGQIAGGLKRIPLIKFGARGPEPSRGRGRGVTYRGKGGTKRLPHAFIATMPSGHRGVYMRTTTRAVRRGPPPMRSALPIRQLFGPSIGRVLDRNKKEILARGEEQTTKEFNRQINRILGVDGAGE